MKIELDPAALDELCVRHDTVSAAVLTGNDVARELLTNYDLDGIQCLSGAAAANANHNTLFTPGSPRSYENYLPSMITNIPLSRRNPLNATGVPENNKN